MSFYQTSIVLLLKALKKSLSFPDEVYPWISRMDVRLLEVSHVTFSVASSCGIKGNFIKTHLSGSPVGVIERWDFVL